MIRVLLTLALLAMGGCKLMDPPCADDQQDTKMHLGAPDDVDITTEQGHRVERWTYYERGAVFVFTWGGGIAGCQVHTESF